MARHKIAITISPELLAELDRLVDRRLFANRSVAIQEAVKEKLERMAHGRLARECAKLDPASEKAMAEDGLAAELGGWPEY